MTRDGAHPSVTIFQRSGARRLARPGMGALVVDRAMAAMIGERPSA